MTDRPNQRRRSLALLLVGFGLAGSLVFAVTPALQKDLVFEFHPAGSAAASSGAMAVAPLAIARETPDALDVALPCEAEFPVSTFQTYEPGYWLSTDGAVRSELLYPDLGEGATFVVSATEAALFIGDDELLRTTLRVEAGCVATASYRAGVWRVQTPDGSVESPGPSPRFVFASFEGPATSHESAVVSVATRELGSSPGWPRAVLFITALAAAIAGLMLAIGRKSESGEAAPTPGGFDRWDAGFVAFLGLWAVLGPAGFDDGWVQAIQTGYDRYGDFSGVFENGASTAPIGYWLNWLQHHWLGLTSNTLLLRLPSIVLGLTAWRLGRWMLASLGRSNPITRWVFLGAMTVGVAAWGMTLRVEPVMSLLLVASAACAVRLRFDRPWWLVPVWVLIVVLGVTAHTSGLVVLAPVIASTPLLVGWIRSFGWQVGVAVTGAAGALVILLLGVDTDASIARQGIDSARSGGHDLSALDELSRYSLLDEAPYGSLARRVAVGLALLAVAVFVARIARRRQLVLPGSALLIAVALLAVTPSKWPWHFGSLVALAAVAIAVAVAEAVEEPGSVGRWWVGALALVATVGAWWVSTPWTALDIRSLSWWGGLGSSPGFVTIVVVAVAAGGLAMSHRAMPWLVVGSSLAAVGLAAAVFAADAIVTPGWTFASQNLKSLVGQGGCGLGDELVVPKPGSLVALQQAPVGTSDADAAAEEAGFLEFGRFSSDGFVRAGINTQRPVADAAYMGSYLGEVGATEEENLGGFWSDWYAIGAEQDVVGVVMLGSLGANRLALQWSASNGELSDRGQIDEFDLEGYYLDWTLLSFPVPDGVDRVRVLMLDLSDVDSRSWLAASSPLGLTTTPVADLPSESLGNIVVSAPLAPYLPCVPTPQFDDTVVRPPDMFIEMWEVPWQTVFAAAAASERYFLYDVKLDPAPENRQIGAHLGDPGHFVFVSQEYLTGAPALANSGFVLTAADSTDS